MKYLLYHGFGQKAKLFQLWKCMKRNLNKNRFLKYFLKLNSKLHFKCKPTNSTNRIFWRHPNIASVLSLRLSNLNFGFILLCLKSPFPSFSLPASLPHFLLSTKKRLARTSSVLCTVTDAALLVSISTSVLILFVRWKIYCHRWWKRAPSQAPSWWLREVPGKACSLTRELPLQSCSGNSPGILRSRSLVISLSLHKAPSKERLWVTVTVDLHQDS